MASTQHTPTELEAAGDLVLPAADELAGSFPLTHNLHPATPEEYNEIMSTLASVRSSRITWPTCAGPARAVGVTVASSPTARSS